jgi:hypothetical protein
LINRGDRFIDLVWGTTPERPSTAALPTIESQALDAAHEFFTATSRSRVETLAYLDSVYSREVDYFGKRTPRAAVLGEKADFVARWPERRYDLRDDASVACRADGTCVVDGLVDWQNYSAPRKATSTGTARFTLTFVRRGGVMTLVGETSEVLARDVRQR